MSILLSFFLYSCSVNQQIYLNPDGSGRVESSVFLENFFLTTLNDLTDLENSGPDKQNRLAPETIEAELKLNPYLTDINVESPQKGEYSGSLGFNHIEELFLSASSMTTGVQTGTSQGRENILDYQELSPGIHKLSISINDKNFQQLFQLFPMLQDPGFQYFLPDQSISESEYQEMLFFIFEDVQGIEERTLRSLLKSASLDLLITVEGQILEQEGGQMLNNSTMRISLPLVKLLLHKEDILYSLTYKSR
jgi:hypothetical protein